MSIVNMFLYLLLFLINRFGILNIDNGSTNKAYNIQGEQLENELLNIVNMTTVIQLCMLNTAFQWVFQNKLSTIQGMFNMIFFNLFFNFFVSTITFSLLESSENNLKFQMLASVINITLNTLIILFFYFSNAVVITSLTFVLAINIKIQRTITITDYIFNQMQLYLLLINISFVFIAKCISMRNQEEKFKLQYRLNRSSQIIDGLGVGTFSFKKECNEKNENTINITQYNKTMILIANEDQPLKEHTILDEISSPTTNKKQGRINIMDVPACETYKYLPNLLHDNEIQNSINIESKLLIFN